MKAPNKIYMTPSYGEPDNVLLASFSKSHLDCHRDIEYVRADALLEWLQERKKYYQSLIPADGAVAFICALDEVTHKINSL